MPNPPVPMQIKVTPKNSLLPPVDHAPWPAADSNSVLISSPSIFASSASAPLFSTPSSTALIGVDPSLTSSANASNINWTVLSPVAVNPTSRGTSDQPSGLTSSRSYAGSGTAALRQKSCQSAAETNPFAEAKVTGTCPNSCPSPKRPTAK
ncbi:unnamed protein product [Protopolystoma xenopodis]|uniref:Uncharacterized protein n=1 Tax=Protopolystoma xenopodis TaxID=117903 RepID=A0A448WY30_9PLAT|nr:unnamed protein product [Protopolystoma xenopodis]